jgi:hypothetical protein
MPRSVLLIGDNDMQNNTFVGKCAHGLRTAPHHHRYLTAAVIVGIWYVAENVLHYAVVAKGVEVFCVVPFAERIFSSVFGAAE